MHIFSNITIESPVLHYSDLSGSNVSNAAFRNSAFYWARLKNMSVELPITQRLFESAEILFSDLTGLTVTKEKRGADIGGEREEMDEHQKRLQLLALVLSQTKSLYGSRIDDDLMDVLETEYPARAAKLFSVENVGAVERANQQNEEEYKSMLRRYSSEEDEAENWEDNWEERRGKFCES